MSDEEQMPIDIEYFKKDRRSLLHRLAVVENRLGIPRSVIPKELRKPWKEFLEEYEGVMLNDYPDDDLDDWIDLKVDKS